MKDMDQEQGTAKKCSLLGCNTGRQIVPGVSVSQKTSTSEAYMMTFRNII